MRPIFSLFLAIFLVCQILNFFHPVDGKPFAETDDDADNSKIQEIPASSQDSEDLRRTPDLPPPRTREFLQDPIELAGLYEGDIVLPEDDPYRNAIIEEKLRWPGGVIPYFISPTFYPHEVSTIVRAFMEYQSKTCITFRLKTTETDFINIVKGKGCSSHVGRTGGPQPVTLGDGCVHQGIIMHELMHAVGFWHEQSRWDRDDFIDVHLQNVAPGMAPNFNKYSWKDIQSLNAPYDTSSIMHYGPYAFAKDRRFATITPKAANPKMGQREAFSAIDIMKINRLYNCEKNGAPPPTASTPAPDSVSGAAAAQPTAKVATLQGGR